MPSRARVAVGGTPEGCPVRESASIAADSKTQILTDAAPIEEPLVDIERPSGRPVLVQEDPSLKQTAAISYVRRGAPAYILSYRQQGDPACQIAAQAGFALRFFSVSPGQRMDFTLPTERRGEVIRRLQIPATISSKVQVMPEEYILPLPS